MGRGTPRRSPYQGLIPYAEDDAAWFFGRDTAREIVLDNLLAYRVSVLYGASGVGKSSLLRAGVARSVQDDAHRRLARGERAELAALVFSSWFGDPLAGLEHAIRSMLESLSPDLAADLPTDSLGDLVAAAAERIDGSLLIILDQFEEYFLYHAADGPLIGELARTLARRDAPVSVLLSMREDRLATLDALDDRIPSLLDHLVRVDHLDRAAARAAIEQPLELWNDRHAAEGEQVGIEPELVDAVLDSVQGGLIHSDGFGIVGGGDRGGDDRIQTPYLQLVMMRLWEEEQRAGSRLLRLSTLARLGGAKRIVATHVDAAIATLSLAEQAVAARVLRQLVTPSGTKIALRTADLAAYAELDEPTVTAVLERLTRGARILQALGDSRYEIYHDALAEPILDWRRRWQEDQDRRRRRRRRRIVASVGAGLVLTLLVVATLALLTLFAQRHAERQADNAASVALASASRDQRASAPDLSALLALAALRFDDRPEARDAMVAARAATASPAVAAIMRGHAATVAAVAFVRDGRAIASAGEDGRIMLFDVERRRSLGRPFTSGRSRPRFTSLAVSPDQRTLAAGGGDGRIRLWSVASRRALMTLGISGSAVHSIAISPDGRTLAAAGDAVRLWDLATRTQRARIRVPDNNTWRVAFSPDGRTLATVGGRYTVRLWDVLSGDRRGRSFSRRGVALTSLAFSPDGRWIGVGGEQTWLWDLRSTATHRLSARSGEGVEDLAFSADGKRLAGAGEGGSTHLWDVATKRPLGPPITGPAKRLGSVAFSPDGRLVATAGRDRRVWLFDTAVPRLLDRQHDTVTDVAFDPSGSTLATAGHDGRIWLWSVRSRRPIGRPLKAQPFEAAAFAPSGRELASAGSHVLLWDLRTRRARPLLRASAGAGAFSSVAFSPSGRQLAAGGERGIVVWSLVSGRTVARRSIDVDGRVDEIAFSPDGRTLASAGSHKQILMWDARTLRPARRLFPISVDFGDLAFSPDGRLLAAPGSDMKLWLWDADTNSTRALGSGDDLYESVAFSADGRTLIVGRYNGGTQLWNVADGRHLGPTLDQEASTVNAVAAGSDGRTFAVAGSAGAPRLHAHILWPDERSLEREVCERVGRGLSRAEWRRYAAGIEYQAMCDS